MHHQGDQVLGAQATSLLGLAVSAPAAFAHQRRQVDWDFVWRRVAVASFMVALLRAAHVVSTMAHPSVSLGIDYTTYVDATGAWLAGNDFYLPSQLTGSYQIVGGEILYPPVVLWLLVPFRFLPAFLWWVVPLAVTLPAIRLMRVQTWGAALTAAIFVLPIVQEPILWGNPVIWLVPAVAWGLLLGWPAALVLVKPTLAPFVAVGLIRPRRLVVGLAVLGAASTPFGAMWVDWVTVIRNSDLPLTYSIRQAALLLIPVVLYLSGDASRATRTRLSRALDGLRRYAGSGSRTRSTSARSRQRRASANANT
jgi:hypothetical protein